MTKITEHTVGKVSVGFSGLMHVHGKNTDDKFDVRANVVEITKFHYLRRERIWRELSTWLCFENVHSTWSKEVVRNFVFLKQFAEIASARSVDDSRTYVATSHFNEHAKKVNVGTHLNGETRKIASKVGKELIPQHIRVAKN